jgi:hypothetical protein
MGVSLLQAEAAPKGALLRSVVSVLATLAEEGFPQVAINYRTEDNMQVVACCRGCCAGAVCVCVRVSVCVCV